jgi:hypothetical protein
MHERCKMTYIGLEACARSVRERKELLKKTVNQLH